MPQAKSPIPNAHGRLSQAHRLWHQAADEYNDAEGFRTNLNSLIEALRNVTFVLQNEKAKIPQFDEWYSSWQARLKADKIMSWLHEARTTIVHKSDWDYAVHLRKGLELFQTIPTSANLASLFGASM